MKITSGCCECLAVRATSSDQCDSSTQFCCVEADAHKKASDPSGTTCVQKSLVHRSPSHSQPRLKNVEF